MSPRKDNTLTVVGWSDPKKGKLYKGRIKKAEVNKKAKCLFVTIENLNPSQLGRIHEVTLPLPVRPGNQTCAFLTACGIAASTVGTKISLEDICGVTIGMRFGAIAEDGWQQIDFKRVQDTPRVQSNTSDDQSESAQFSDSAQQSTMEQEREF
jgi:hypothetical protein